MRANQPEASSLQGLALWSRYSTATERDLLTRALNPATLRQPSKNSTASSEWRTMRGLISTRNGTGLRSRAARSSGGRSLRYCSRSSITASCRETPTCGAASPTPGASYIVSRIQSISCCTSSERISERVNSRATCRNTSSPDWTIFNLTCSTVVDGLADLALDRATQHGCYPVIGV